MHLVVPLLMFVATDEPPAPRHFVATPEIILSIDEDAGPAAVARAWISRDDGTTWELAEAARVGEGSLSVRVPRDGRYGIFLSQSTDADSLGDVPLPGRTPQAVVIVDTAVPTLQVRAISAVGGAATADPPQGATGQRSLRFEMTLIDENLGPQAVQVFHRPAAAKDAAWIAGGYAAREGADWRWTVPDALSGEVSLRILATDLAGNRATDDRGPIRLPVPAARTASSAADHNTRINAPVSIDDASTPTSPVSAALRHAASTDGGLLNGNSADVSPVLCGAAGSPPGGAAAARDRSGNADQSHAPGTNSRTRQLRDSARAYLERGRPRLAMARLDDALEISPEDVQLRSLRGMALLRSGDTAAARTELLAALADSPDHVEAIDGLARIAAQTGNLELSRGALGQLTKLQPDEARHWLDYGDVLFKSGLSTDAYAAWTAARDRAKPADRLHSRAVERLHRFAPAP